MIWIAPSEKDRDSEALEKRLWASADQLRANSGLTSQQYSQPVLGLIFLRFAGVRFAARRSELERAASSGRCGSRVDEPSANHAEDVLYPSPSARFDYLLALPEGEAVGKALSDAMRDIEKNNRLQKLWPALKQRRYARVIGQEASVFSPSDTGREDKSHLHPAHACLWNGNRSFCRTGGSQVCRPGFNLTNWVKSDNKSSMPTWFLDHRKFSSATVTILRSTSNTF
jgi:hypothetical protein